MFSGSRLTKFYLINMLSWMCCKVEHRFFETVILAVIYILRTYLSCFPIWTRLKVFIRPLGNYRTWEDFPGFCADAVVHHPGPPFRTGAPVLQLPRAMGSWLPTPATQSYGLLTTHCWIPWKDLPLAEGVRLPGSQTLPKGSLDPVTGQCGTKKTWSSPPQFRTTLKSHLRFLPPPSPIRWAKVFAANASWCNCLLCPVLFLFLFTGFCSKYTFQQTPYIQIQGLSRKPDLRQIHSFSTTYERTKPFWYFPSCGFCQSINKYWSLGNIGPAKHKSNKTKLKTSTTYKWLDFMLLSRIFHRNS